MARTMQRIQKPITRARALDSAAPGSYLPRYPEEEWVRVLVRTVDPSARAVAEALKPGAEAYPTSSMRFRAAERMSESAVGSSASRGASYSRFSFR